MSEQAPQTLANHTRYDPIYHFFALPVIGLTIIVAAIHVAQRPNWFNAWMVLFVIAVAILAVKARFFAEAASLSAQGAGPHHSTGRTGATCRPSFRPAASEDRRTERRAVSRASFRLGCRNPRPGAGNSSQETVEGRYQEVDQELARRLFPSVNRGPFKSL